MTSTASHPSFALLLFLDCLGTARCLETANQRLEKERVPAGTGGRSAELADARVAEIFDSDIASHFSDSVEFEDVRRKAGRKGKPIMALLMVRRDMSCMALRYSMNKGREVRSLLERFVVVYIEDNGGKAKAFQQDGQEYVPQTHFFTKDGKRLAVHSSPTYKYMFGDEAALAEGMRKALKMTEGSWKSWFTSPFDLDIDSQVAPTSEPAEVHKLAKDSNKPLMVLVTQPWCPVCKNLIKTINGGSKVRELLPSFLFVHAGEEKKALGEWQEKGENYVPQAYFYTAAGDPLEVLGPNPRWKRCFDTERRLAKAMKLALSLAHSEEL